MSSRKDTQIKGCKGYVPPKDDEDWGHREELNCLTCTVTLTESCEWFRKRTGFVRVRTKVI